MIRKKSISRYCPFKSLSTILALLCQVEYREVVRRVAEGAVLVATPSKDAKEVREPIYYSTAVLRIRIRIHQIHMFLGLLDTYPDPLVRGMDPDPDPFIIKQK
jgi:hypothetical protein